MKKLIMMMTLMMCLVGMSYGQDTIKYDDVIVASIRPKGSYTTYISKNGEIFKIGKEIQLGYPSNSIFVHITVFDYIGTVYPPLNASDGNSKSIIKKILIGGNKRMGFRVLLETTSMSGVNRYLIQTELAIEVGELKTSMISSDEALSELKKCKDKLDLGLMTQEEFDKKKENLSKFIK